MAERKWDSGLIARTIRNLYRQGHDVSYNAMAEVNQGLVSAANYYYGSYRKAVAAAGIDYADVRRKPRWTRQRVVDAIQAASKAKQDLSWAKVSARRDELGCAAKAAIRERLFGNWNDALKKAGLDPEEISRYRHWEPDAILKELRRRVKKKEPVNSKVIQEEIPGLYGAAVRHFGSYEEALEKSGINPDEIVQRRDWDKRAVNQRLREFEKTFGLISQVMLRKYDSGLLRAVRIFYGNLKPAIKAAGIRNYSIRGHRQKGDQALLFDETPGWRQSRAGKAAASAHPAKSAKRKR